MLLRNHGLMDDLRFRYLAAKCLAEVKEWDECLSLLGDGEMDDGMQLAGTVSGGCGGVHMGQFMYVMGDAQFCMHQISRFDGPDSTCC